MFNLTKEELVVANALQKYGMVVIDIAQGQPVYAERLSENSGKLWEGKLHLPSFEREAAHKDGSFSLKRVEATLEDRLKAQRASGFNPDNCL